MWIWVWMWTWIAKCLVQCVDVSIVGVNLAKQIIILELDFLACGGLSNLPPALPGRYDRRIVEKAFPSRHPILQTARNFHIVRLVPWALQIGWRARWRVGTAAIVSRHIEEVCTVERSRVEVL